MSRLVVVSNRVAPITEGEPTAGGLAAGVLDALKQKGGIWFGWSGEITEDSAATAHVERTVGSITLCTVDLARSDYDAFYRGFANGTLWPTLHYQVGHAHFDCRRKIEMTPGAQSRNDTPGDGQGKRHTRHHRHTLGGRRGQGP
jgi:trehalose 6-phosphate synthase